MVNSLFSIVFNCIDESFSFAETIWGAFGISFFIFFVTVVGIHFVVRNFIGIFIK